MSRIPALGRTVRILLLLTAAIALGSIRTAQLDPKAISIQLPKDIKWTGNPGGNQTAVLYGDPSKPGLYIVLTKWPPNRMSRPHSHPNDRYITVISGTWWVGTGTNYNPDTTTPVPAGSYVTHFAKQVHYDGAKNEEVLLQIVGMGPASSASSETK
jgi:quercetin dioxygenase-like cupin family protein